MQGNPCIFSDGKNWSYIRFKNTAAGTKVGYFYFFLISEQIIPVIYDEVILRIVVLIIKTFSYQVIHKRGVEAVLVLALGKKFEI